MVFSINANDETAKQQMELGNLTSHDLEYMNNVSRPTIYPVQSIDDHVPQRRTH